MKLLRLKSRPRQERTHNSPLDPIDLDLEKVFADPELLDAVLDALEWYSTDTPEDLAARAHDLEEIAAKINHQAAATS